MSSKRFSGEQWRAWFKEFNESELTVQQFCESKGTTANTFYNWRRKLRAEAQSLQESQADSAFVSVKLPSVQVEFEFHGGVVVRVANDHESLEPLVKVLCDLGSRP